MLTAYTSTFEVLVFDILTFAKYPFNPYDSATGDLAANIKSFTEGVIAEDEVAKTVF